jgi:hypothetical protein
VTVAFRVTSPDLLNVKRGALFGICCCLFNIAIGNPDYLRSNNWMTANNDVGVGDPVLLQVTARRFREGTEENYENFGSDSRYRRCCIYVMTTVL